MNSEFLKSHGWHIAKIAAPVACFAVLLILARLLVHRRPESFAGANHLLRRLARPWPVPILLVFILALGNGLLVTWVAGAPRPRVHDEFSYLLSGDTFARGRMTNPTPALWTHFETMHILFEPTYASKFQPLQGVTLALGQVLFGRPWIGALVTNALACAVMSWALRAWILPKWAFLAGLIAGFHPQIMEWGHSYWGGGVGMVGGSIVLGALGRILRGRRGLALWSSVLAVGGAIIAGTRPWEALTWSVLAGLTLTVWLIRRPHPHRAALLARVAIPIACILIPAGALQAYYNWRVTGDPLLLPYLSHARTYMSVPLMLWQPIPEPKTYRSKPLDQQYREFEWNLQMSQRESVTGYLKFVASKLYSFARWFLMRDLPLLLGLLVLPLVLGRNRMTWLALAYGIGFSISYAITPYLLNHYVGAAMGVMFVLSMRGLQWICTRGPTGRAFVGLCCLSCLPVLGYFNYTQYQENNARWVVGRQNIEQRLSERGPEDDLVFVYYGPEHSFHFEWVFNSGDIDSQKVIWARGMSLSEDQELIDHYPSRAVWIVYADEEPPRLEPVPRPSQ